MKGVLYVVVTGLGLSCAVALLALETPLIPISEIDERRVPMSTVFYGDVPDAGVHTSDFRLAVDDEGPRAGSRSDRAPGYRRVTFRGMFSDQT